jgi:dihydroorotate dehydrogenase electron transfer subunit
VTTGSNGHASHSSTPGTARGSILLVDAEIISQNAFAGDQHILRVQAPECACRATPGSFAHVTCDGELRLRRPLSIMRASKDEGWLEFLYKPVGVGLAELAAHGPGQRLNLLAPIGRGFTADPERPVVLAIGGGVGIPPMIFLAETLKDHPRRRLVVFMGSEVPFPFELVDPAKPLEGAPGGATAAIRLLEGWGVDSRLASRARLAGCYPGWVTELAREWLQAQSPATLAAAQIHACGPMPMLEAVAALAHAFALPCQIAVEEYMACAVGGCAGCTISVRTPSGQAMKRVCVDGPVFDASEVFPPPSTV